MGNLYRWCAGCVLALVFVAGVSAETLPALEKWTYQVNSPKYDTALAAATAAYELATPPSGYSKLNGPWVSGTSCAGTSFVSGSGIAYKAKWNATGAEACLNASGMLALSYACNTGGTLSGQSCIYPNCAAGYDRNAQGQCVKDCTGKAGQLTTNGTYAFGGAASTWSVSECKVYCPQRVISAFGGTGYGCKYTGASADPEAESGKPEPPDPEKLPPEKPEDCLNRGSGYVTSSTGKITCVPSSEAPEGQKPSKKESDSVKESGTKNADGTIDKTSSDYKKEESSTSQGADGTTTTNKKETIAGTPDGNGNVTCPSGYTKNTDNTCSKTTTTQQSNSGFCEQNPNSPLCKEAKESRFGGGCDSGFTCDGDAATCASARAAHELKCSFQPDATTALHDSENPGGTSGQLAKASEALNADGTKDFNIATEFSAKNQQWVNFSSGCPVGVQQFSILGKTLEIDASIVCDIGLFIRLMVHIVAYLGLARVFATKLV